jgi:hypothetical protein
LEIVIEASEQHYSAERGAKEGLGKSAMSQSTSHVLVRTWEENVCRMPTTVATGTGAGEGMRL